MGIAIGFILPPMIVKENFNDMEKIGEELHMLYLGVAVAATIIFVLICFCK